MAHWPWQTPISSREVLHLVFRCIILQDCACQHDSLIQKSVRRLVGVRNWMVHQDLVQLVPGVSSKHFPESDVDVLGLVDCRNACLPNRVVEFLKDVKVLLFRFPILNRESVLPVQSKVTNKEQ
eukprot:9012169-Ditylum_brightwellii.AAC.1